jgi:hypothetical protein
VRWNRGVVGTLRGGRLRREEDRLADGRAALEYDPALRVHGILAAPPCTMFARVGARWKRTEEQMRDALSIVDACLRLVYAYKPVWWALENPIGKLKRYLGEPVYKCDPCDFGDPWTKRIWLWGDFKPPMATLTVRPEYPAHRPARARDRTSMLSSSQRRERARTSSAFARAFFEANA